MNKFKIIGLTNVHRLGYLAGYFAALESSEVRELVKALEFVQFVSSSDAFIGVFQIADIHGMPYRGGQYGEVVKSALAAFRKMREGVGNG